MTNIKCIQCGLNNSPNSPGCRRCGAVLSYTGNQAFAQAAPYAANPPSYRPSNTTQFATARAETPWYGLDIPFVLEGFEGHDMVLRTRILSGIKLLVDGTAMARKGRRIQLVANNGSPVELRLKTRFLDPVPNIEVYGRTIVLLPALNAFEYLWSGIPLILLFLGGGVGGAFGGLACAINAQLFRTRLSTPVKFAISGVITASAFVAWLIVAVIITLLFRGPGKELP